MLKNLVQNPVILPLTDSLGHALQCYFASSSSEKQLRAREQLFGRLFSFLDNIRSLDNPEIRDRLDFILRLAAPGKMLDLGYYDGMITQELSRRGYEIIGIDYIHRNNAARFDNGNNNIFLTAYAEALPFGDNSFDTVVASHTLEHVFDINITLAEASRVLKPNGMILAIVPRKIGNKPTHIRDFDSPEKLEDAMSGYFRKLAYFSRVGEGHAYIGTPNKV